jgi:alpha-amylase
MRAPPSASFFLLFLLVAGCASAPHAPEPAEAPDAAQARPAPLVNLTAWQDSVLYFVLLDRFADGDPSNNFDVDRAAKGAFHGGDLKGLIAQLDAIADLGVTALSINPVVKNVPGAYHGYWADDFTVMDPRFGSEDDLRALVDAAHRRGMRVLLAVVYNHAGHDSQYLTDPKTRGWLRSEAAGTCGTDDLTACLAGLPDFKTEEPAVRDYLMEAHLGLAQRTGIDGFRLDAANHVDHAFWKEHRARTRTRLGQDFFLVGEVRDEMDAGLDFSFQESALAWLSGGGSTVDFDRYLKGREAVAEGHLLSHFLSSHDVPGTLFQLKGNRHLFSLLVVLQMSVGGLPMVYYGEEVARLDGPDSDMPWGSRPIDPGRNLPRDESMRAFYKKMIGIRRAHAALSRGVHESLSRNSDLLVFLRRDEATRDAVLVAVNRGEGLAVAEVEAPAEWGGRAPLELLSGEPLPGDARRLTVALPAKTARVYGVPGETAQP